MEGDLNKIKSASEKKGGKKRSKGGFRCFRQFIRDMQMNELNFSKREWTWANNREGKGFVEEGWIEFLLTRMVLSTFNNNGPTYTKMNLELLLFWF